MKRDKYRNFTEGVMFGVGWDDIYLKTRSKTKLSMKSRQKTFFGETAIKLFLPAALLLLTFELFIPAFSYDFTIFDEKWQVVENPLIRSLAFDNIIKMFSSLSITSYYPVRLMTFAFDYAIWELNPAGYHLSNILIHLANVLLLYSFMLRLKSQMNKSVFVGNVDEGDSLEIEGKREQQESSLKKNEGMEIRFYVISTFAASLFAFHPVIVEPVVWIGGREELLTVFFALVGFHFYISGTDSGEDRSPEFRKSSLRRRFYRYSSYISCVAACLSNVIGAIVPALLIGYEKFVKRERSRRRIFSRLWFFVLAGGGTVILKFITKNIAYRHNLHQSAEKALELSLFDRVMTIFHLFFINVKKILAPTDLMVQYSTETPDHILILGCLAGILFAAGAAALFRYAEGAGGIRFGLWWFTVSILPALQVVPHHILHSDRFLYLPMVGFAATAAFGMHWIARSAFRFKTTVAVAALLAALLFTRSRSQMKVWKDSKTLFHHTLSIAPDLTYAHMNLGQILLDEGKTDEARKRFQRVIELSPGDAEAYTNIGNAFLREKRFEESAEYYRKALSLRPEEPKMMNNLAVALQETGRREEALTFFQKALSKKPDDAMFLINTGILFLESEKYEVALEYFKRASESNPDDAGVYQLMGDSFAALGNLAEAVKCYGRYLEIKPGSVLLRNEKAMMAAALGDVNKAKSELRTSIQIDPSHPGAYYYLGRLSVERKEYSKAADFFRQSLSLAPDFSDARFQLALTYLRLGDAGQAKREYETLRKYDQAKAAELQRFFQSAQ